MKFLAMTALSALAAASVMTTPSSAKDQASPYLGDVILLAGIVCPRGWLEADGRYLSIADNQDLFSVMRTTYGGDARMTFALPDLRGRVPVHFGQGRGLENLTPGQRLGADTMTLTVEHMPSHRHALYANNEGTNVVSPAGATLSNFTTPGATAYQNPPDSTMDDDLVGYIGFGDPVSLASPSVAMRYCVNTDGAIPPRK